MLGAFARIQGACDLEAFLCKGADMALTGDWRSGVMIGLPARLRAAPNLMTNLEDTTYAYECGYRDGRGRLS